MNYRVMSFINFIASIAAFRWQIIMDKTVK